MDVKVDGKCGANNSNNTGFQLWRQDNHPIELFTQAVTHQKLDYIHNNPVMAGFVESPEEYLYSSAKDYYGLPSVLFTDIILVEPMLMR
jgi:putative transposase